MRDDSPSPPTPSDQPGNGQAERSIARLHLWQIQPVRDIAVILVVLWLINLGYAMSIVTVPLLLGLLLAYLLEPPIAWVAKHRGRPFAAGLALAVMGLVIAVPVAGAVGVATAQGLRFIGGFDDDLTKFLEKVEQFLTIVERDRVKVVIDEQGRVTGIQPGDPRPAEESSAAPGADAKNGAGAGASQPVPGDEAGDAQRAPARPEPAREDNADATPENGQNGDPPPAPDDGADAEPDAQGEDDRTLVQKYAAVLRRALRENFGSVSKQVAAGGANFIQVGWDVLLAVGAFAFKYLFLTPFFFFFWSISLGRVKEFGAGMIPQKHRKNTLRVVRKMDAAIAAFIRGRFTIATILAVGYTIAYWIVGVPAPFIFGPIVGFASAVPYLPLLGWPATMLAMAIDQAGAVDPYPWWWIIAGPTIVYFAFQTLDDYVLTPLIQGKNVGLSTPVILFAVLGAGALAGVYGVLIAIPLAACVKIIITDVFFPRYKAWVEGRAEDPLPITGHDDDEAQRPNPA